MKKVLIITYYWPPAGGSGVQRWLKFVKYFREFGIEPIVYTVAKQSYPITDESLLKDIPEAVEILKTSIFEPGHLMQSFGNQNKQSVGFLKNKPGLINRFLYFIRANYFIPDSRKYWIKPSVRFLKKYLLNNPIDAIISTGPPHSTHLIAKALKDQLGVKWIADFRDPWTKIDYFHQLPLTRRAIKKHKRLENSVLSSADSLVVVGDTMKKDFLNFNANTHTITNGFDNEIIRTGSNLDAQFSVLHIGLMNESRSPDILWRSLANLTKSKEEFAKHFKLKLIGKIADTVFQAVDKANLKEHVEIIDYLPHDKIAKHLEAAQVLLLIVNDVPSAKGILTGKVFEYLASGRPILVIGPEDGDLAALIDKTSGGVVVDRSNEKKLTSQLEHLFKEYTTNGIAPIANENSINAYHRKELTRVYSELIKSLCS